VTKRLFAKATPGLVRARYIVDVLLLIAFLTIGVTGILINKTLFAIHVAGNATTLHYFASAIAILLMGVHLGLHADYIFGKLFRKGANRIVKLATAVVLALLVAFGGYSLFTTQFVSYLAAPIQAAAFSHGTFQPNGAPALDGSSEDRPLISRTAGVCGRRRDFNPVRAATAALQPPQGDGNTGLGGRGGQGQGGGFGGGEGAGGGHREGGSTSAALLIAQYVGIIALFGAATYGMIKLIGRKKKPEPDETAIVAAVIDEPDAEPPLE
jgi:uncharacterized membrane protein YgcG